jgi:hypothetical protein
MTGVFLIVGPWIAVFPVDSLIMAATSPAISYITQNPATCPTVNAASAASLCADELCDELLGHMLDCDLCLNRSEHACCAYKHYQNQIALAGRPQQGVVFAF